MKRAKIDIRSEDGKIVLEEPKFEFDLVLVGLSSNGSYYAVAQTSDSPVKKKQRHDWRKARGKARGTHKPQPFPINERQEGVKIDRRLIEMIKEVGIKQSLYDHAAMVHYIHERYSGDYYNERGVSIPMKDWETILLISERWARSAIKRLEEAGLILVRVNLDKGKRTNRYVVSKAVIQLLDPPGLEQADAQPGRFTYRVKRFKK